MAFFDNQSDLRDSDEERVGFAKYYLSDLRFLYKDSQHENKKVYQTLLSSSTYIGLIM
jgi:hypothetical protein